LPGAFSGWPILKSSANFPYALDPIARIDFRIKFMKGSKLIQLVEFYRNEEGQPRQKGVVSLGMRDCQKSKSV
jgi:hypothetical protein